MISTTTVIIAAAQQWSGPGNFRQGITGKSVDKEYWSLCETAWIIIILTLVVSKTIFHWLCMGSRISSEEEERRTLRRCPAPNNMHIRKYTATEHNNRETGFVGYYGLHVLLTHHTPENTRYAHIPSRYSSWLLLCAHSYQWVQLISPVLSLICRRAV